MNLADIEALFERAGGRQYAGEPVTQLAHALQCAQLARDEAAPAALVVAALLHDIGHLINDRGDSPTLRGIDDRHEQVAIPRLRGLFGPEVLEPIRLHVEAKRYLCARGDGRLDGPAYFASLSPDSVRSLALQGGVFDDAQADAFRARPYADGAIAVRRWDDRAKRAGAATPPLREFLDLAATVARS